MSDNTKPIHVLTIYDGFFSGGTRIAHTNLILALNKNYQQEHRVLSIFDKVQRDHTVQTMEDDNCYKKLKKAGIHISTLGKYTHQGRHFDEDEIKQAQEEINQADVIISLKEQPLLLIQHLNLGKKPLIVCLHRSDPESQGPGVSILANIVKERPENSLVISCSDSGRVAYNDAIGSNSVKFIPNGIDLNKFHPSKTKNKFIRKELKIPDYANVIIFSGRFDDVKDIPLFIASLREYCKTSKTWPHIILCGAGMAEENKVLMGIIQAHPLEAKLHLLGIQHKMADLYCAADIVALTSTTEAYPLCLIEGMACGAVPVATNVGDSKDIVGECGYVTSRDPKNIATNWNKALTNRHELHIKARMRIDEFDHRYMVQKYFLAIQEALTRI